VQKRKEAKKKRKCLGGNENPRRKESFKNKESRPGRFKDSIDKGVGNSFVKTFRRVNTSEKESRDTRGESQKASLKGEIEKTHRDLRERAEDIKSKGEELRKKERDVTSKGTRRKKSKGGRP